MSVCEAPRVQTGLLGEGRHVFVCKKYPFEILRSCHLPMPNENLIDENFVHKLNLSQTNITCENFRLGDQTVRVVGKVCTTVQTIAAGAIVGSMQLKATVVRDLKLIFGTEALPGQKLSQKLSKFETSNDVNELRSMKNVSKKKIKKTEPTKIEMKPEHLDLEKEPSYLQYFMSQIKNFQPYLSRPSLSSSQEVSQIPKPDLDQEPPYHTQYYAQVPPKSPDLSNTPARVFEPFSGSPCHDWLRSPSPKSKTDSKSPDGPASIIGTDETADESSDDECLDTSRNVIDDDCFDPMATPPKPPVPHVRGLNGMWHLKGESPAMDRGWKTTRTGSQPQPSVPSPQSPHWYADENQKTYMKYLLKEDPKGVQNVFNLKRLTQIDLPHGPVWCRELCQDLHPQYRPEQCGYTGKDLPSNFQACSYSCTGAWCSCVASYAGRGFWS